MKWLILMVQLSILSDCFSQNIPLQVINTKQSTCEQIGNHCKLQNRIVTQTLANDTIITTIGVIANCAGISEIKAFSDGNDSLKLYYIEGKKTFDTLANGNTIINQSSARCNCCFEFTFTVKGLIGLPIVTTINDSVIKYYPDKYKLFPVRFDFIKDDTVNLIDKYGRRQGKWLYPDENNFEDTIGDSISFVGYYYNNWLKTCEYRMYSKGGKIAYEKIQTNFRDFIITEYFIDGNISNQWIKYEGRSSIYYNYFPNKRLKYVTTENNNFTEEIEYYESGQIKEIKNNLIYKVFYENGQIMKEFFHSKNIQRKYYYDNGNLMAIYSNRRSISRWKYYDINGKKSTREQLIGKGFTILKD